MPCFQFIWDHRPGGKLEHVAEHGIKPEEAEHVVMYRDDVQPSRFKPGRLFARGHTAAGRPLGVAYVHWDELTVYVITAFNLEE